MPQSGAVTIVERHCSVEQSNFRSLSPKLLMLFRFFFLIPNAYVRGGAVSALC